jgi:dsRNA-specific ribonuclease
MNIQIKEKDPSWFFPKRNGITPSSSGASASVNAGGSSNTFIITEGTNYDSSTLKYSTPVTIANKLAKSIVNFYAEKGITSLMIHDVCGCIGGTALAFADSPAVELVATYEPSVKHAGMLRANIEGYKMGQKILLYQEFFTGAQTVLPGSAMFFDPPWLAVEVEEAGVDKLDYILSDMKLGQYGLDDYLKRYRGIAYVIAFHLPPRYNFLEVSGWRYIYERLEKRTLIYCICDESLPAAKETSGGMVYYKKFWNEIAQEVVTPFASATALDGSAEESKEDDGSWESFVKYSSSLPRYQRDNSLNQAEGTKSWYLQLQKFLYFLLKSFIADETKVIKLVNASSMILWARSFTHSSYDAKDNYESMETVGDGVLKYTFPKFLYHRFPGITPSQLSNYNMYYMSKPFQSDLSIKMGFPGWVRIRNARIKSIDVAEDLFEAFCGTLDYLCDQFGSGMGSSISQGLISLIFKKFRFDPDKAVANPKTQIFEIPTRLQLGTAKDNITNTYIDGVYTITFSQNLLNGLRELGYNFTNPIAKVSNNIKDDADTKAYYEAYNKLYEQGLTQNRVGQLRAEKALALEDPNLVARVKAKALKEYNSTNIQFKLDNNGGTKIMRLLVFKVDGTSEVLSELPDGSNAQLLQAYLDKVY